MTQRRRERRSPWRGLILIAVLALGAWFLWARGHAPAPAALDDAAGEARPESTVPVPAAAPPKPPGAASEASVGAPVAPPAEPHGELQAPPSPPNWPAARAAQLEVIRRSGPIERALADRATRVFAGWAEASDAPAVESAGECHRDGCFVTFRFGSSQHAKTFYDHVISPGDPAADWPGARQQLEPIPLPGGKVSVTWMLLPPG